jgi:2,3-bisphosphoglycerate-dependent phosphoglycerate mutase
MNSNYLVLVRHGQSEWNAKNLFTGWKDPGLTENGTAEAIRAGKHLKSLGLSFDVLYTSALVRAQLTGKIMLDELGQSDLETIEDKALNERDYGELTGLNKDEARENFGIEQVQVWRRSYDIAPPGGESLKDTYNRVIPYFENKIQPLMKDKNVLISAHGNSLRALVKYLDDISEADIIKLEIGTGEPIVYKFTDGKFIKESHR